MMMQTASNFNNNEKEEEDNNNNDGWSRLSLTESERAVVAYWRVTGKWITPVQLRQQQQQQEQQQQP
jgi:hypothetical protein